MFLSKLKMAMTAAGRCDGPDRRRRRCAQQGTRPSNDTPGERQRVASPTWTYQILASRDGEPPRKVAVVQMTDDTPIRVDAPARGDSLSAQASTRVRKLLSPYGALGARERRGQVGG